MLLLLHHQMSIEQSVSMPVHVVSWRASGDRFQTAFQTAINLRTISSIFFIFRFVFTCYFFRLLLKHIWINRELNNKEDKCLEYCVEFKSPSAVAKRPVFCFKMNRFSSLVESVLRRLVSVFLHFLVRLRSHIS